MKKKIQKPFNVEAAKNGAVIETVDGNSVRILCYDRAGGNGYPIIALINFGGMESCQSYTSEGKLLRDSSDRNDLVIIEEVEATKFNVGDWVFMNTHGSQPWLVIKVTPNYYEIKDSSGYITAKSHHTIDSLFHLWTLKDAKPGNILASTDKYCPFIFKGFYYDGAPTAYCGIDTTDSIYISDEDLPWTRDTVRPATYEERQQFFNRLEAEGYKWNAESLTLTKIQKKWRYKEAEGYKWNSDTLTLSKVEKWRDKEGTKMNGYYISSDATIYSYDDGVLCRNSYNVFATKKQAKSALAMAQISQIMANDERFGGVVTDEEWTDKSWYSIIRINNDLRIATRFCYELLAFHTKKQADLFLEENRDLVKDYYMMD